MSSEQHRRAAHAAHGTRRSPGIEIPRGSAHRRRSVPLASQSDKITTIGAGQGAHVTTRENAFEAADAARRNAQDRYLKRHPEAARAAASGPARSRKNTLIVVLAAVAALALLFIVVRFVAGALSPAPADSTGDGVLISGTQRLQSDDSNAPSDPDQDQTTADGTLSYSGNSYALAQQDGGLWGLVRSSQDGSSQVLFNIEGTPVAIVRYQNVFVVPENRDGNWDVVCYVLGNTEATYVMDANGTQVGGSGSIQSVKIDGSTLHVTDDAGSTTDVALA